MNTRTARYATWPSSQQLRSIAAGARALARALLVRVRAGLDVGASSSDLDEIVGMSRYQLRDIGAESALALRRPAERDQYPRF